MSVNITRPVPPPAVKLLLTPKEAAQTLGVSTRTLFTWTASGQLPAVRLGARSVRYAMSDLENFIAARRQSA